jgi:signal transduction histidine kinase
MDLAISYAVVSLVTLCAVVFLLALNFKHARRDIRQLDFRLVSMQLITLTLWVLLGTKLLDIATPREQLGYLFLFVVAFVVGILLLIHTYREVGRQQTVYELLHHLHGNNDRLKEIDAQKTEFVSLASHQLRRPLTAIHGHATMMLEGEFGKVPKALEEPLKKIIASSTSLGDIVNDFLDVAHLEKGELTYTIKPFNLIDTLNSALVPCEKACAKNHVAFTKTFDGDDVVIVLGDAAKIEKMFRILFENAVMYTPAGKITVSVAQKEKDAIITIADSGIGIPKEDIEHLFKKFKRASNANNASVLGSGLGLFVAKEIVEAHGGRIWVESPGVNKGARFFVALPLKD